jgi:hypothetical protein
LERLCIITLPVGFQEVFHGSLDDPSVGADCIRDIRILGFGIGTGVGIGIEYPVGAVSLPRLARTALLHGWDVAGLCFEFVLFGF